MANSLLIPKKVIFEILALAVTIAADLETPCLKVPFNGVVSSVNFVPRAALTGADTNHRKQSVLNKGQAGTGALSMAALNYDSGVDMVAFDEKPLSLASEVSRTVLKDDILSFKSEAIGTGLADPGGLVVIEITRTL